MQRLIGLLWVTLALTVVSACSQVPETSSYLYSTQGKMRAVHHWDLIAKDVSKQINKQFMEKKASTDEDGKTVLPSFFVKKQNETVFGESFHDLLVSRMVNLGMPVAVNNVPEFLTVEYKVVGVNYEANRNSEQAATFVGQVFRRSILLVRDVLTLGAFPAQDVSHSEVIVTVSIADDNKYLMRSTFIYYIDDPDFWHYEKSVPSRKTIRLTSQ